MLMLEYKCGLLTFKGYVKKNNRNEILSVCECGNEYSQPKSKFAKKHCISCGCYKKDKSKENGKHNSTHGMTKTPIHRIWGSMKQRCYNPKDSHYEFYGEKGIEVFEEWKNDFLTFYRWAINNGYVNGLSIERKNNNEGYNPKNCIWIPFEFQYHSNGRNYRIYINDKFYNLRQYSVLKNLSYESLRTFAFRKNIPKEISEEDFLRQYRAKPTRKL